MGTDPKLAPAEGNDASGGEIKKLEFTQEQLDALVEKRLARDRKEVKEKLEKLGEFESKINTLTNELEEARVALRTAPRGSEEAKQAQDDIDSIKNKLGEVERANKKLIDQQTELNKAIDNYKKQSQEKDSEMLELRKVTAMQFAINKLPFIDPEAVLEITRKNVEYDPENNTFFALNDNKKPRYNAQGEIMSLDELYTDLIQQKKFWARSDALSGLGSSESRGGTSKDRIVVTDIFGPKSDGKRANQLKLSDPARYAELKRLAKEQRLI